MHCFEDAAEPFRTSTSLVRDAAETAAVGIVLVVWVEGRAAFHQCNLLPGCTSRSGATRMTSSSLSRTPNTSTSERTGPTCRAGRLTTARTSRPVNAPGEYRTAIPAEDPRSPNSGPKSILKRQDGLRASGKGSARTILPTLMSTFMKSSIVICGSFLTARSRSSNMDDQLSSNGQPVSSAKFPAARFRGFDGPVQECRQSRPFLKQDVERGCSCPLRRRDIVA